MIPFQSFLDQRLDNDGFTSEDCLASVLPLIRQVITSHTKQKAAPLQGLSELMTEGVKIWYKDTSESDFKNNNHKLKSFKHNSSSVVEVTSEWKREEHNEEDFDFEYSNLNIGERGKPFKKPVYFTGYLSWEHELNHHDPISDIFSIGMIMASLCCGLNFNEKKELEKFVSSRENLFFLNPNLHPVIAQMIVQMTELYREKRPQDLKTILFTLENYRDQRIDFETALAGIHGFESSTREGKQQLILEKLQERLFDISRRNRLLHFKETMQTVNLTKASVPLSFAVESIRPDHILTWGNNFKKDILSGKEINLSKYINFREAPYIPGLFDRIRQEAKRDETEYGFMQLRLVVCFLQWSNLKEKPHERYNSPLVLIPLELKKKKGVRDSYYLKALSEEAEVNPVIRYLFQSLYNIQLPESINLNEETIEGFHHFLEQSIKVSEPGVKLNKLAKPQIDLVIDSAKRTLNQYQSRSRLSGRAIRSYMDIDYSYDQINFHPLGVRLFNNRVRRKELNLEKIINDESKRKHFMVDKTDDGDVQERQFYSIREDREDNPYSWNFDLCNITIGSMRYGKMSLVRDYTSLLNSETHSQPFDSIFSLAPKPIDSKIEDTPNLIHQNHIISCDPTQNKSIVYAQKGKSYIIQGPPGTGKSQAITNLITDYIYRGKRVLFVCEKRAAIDVVYHRLKQKGLHTLCCLIHDSQADKKSFVMDLKDTYEYLLKENKENHSKCSEKREQIIGKISQSLEPILEFNTVMQKQENYAGISNRTLLEKCIASNSQKLNLSELEEEKLANYDEWLKHQDEINRLEKAFQEMNEQPSFFHHPLKQLRADLCQQEHPLETITHALEQSQTHILELEQNLKKLDLETAWWDSIKLTQSLTNYAKHILPLIENNLLSLLEPDSDLSRKFKRHLKKLNKKEEDYQQKQNKNQSWLQKLSADDTETAYQQALVFESSFFRFLNPSWWRLRKTMSYSYDFNTHKVRPTWSQVLKQLKDEYDAEKNFNDFKEELVDEYNLSDELDEILVSINNCSKLDSSSQPALSQFQNQLLKSEKSSAKETIQLLNKMDLDLNRLDQQCLLFIEDYNELNYCELKQTFENIKQNQNLIHDFIYCLEIITKLPKSIAASLRNLDLTIRDLESAILHKTFKKSQRNHRILKRYSNETRYLNVTEAEKHLKDWYEINAKLVIEKVRENFLKNINISQSPAAELSQDEKTLKKQYNKGRRECEHEFGKSMRYKSIRHLCSNESGMVVSDMKPVFLMSPLSVSDTLPLDESLFDVVIFDEASQITLEEAIPSIFRASQSIVVGDEMQLPPTNFFNSSKASNDNLISVEEEGETVEYDLSSNSFLTHVSRNLPSQMLGWHYRSRSESLISFSNWTFYNGRLLTVPDENLSNLQNHEINIQNDIDIHQGMNEILARPLSFHFLGNGVYQNRRNAHEAKYIAETVRQFLMSEKQYSIGIIAFSEAQQNEIENALNDLGRLDNAFRDKLELEYEREEDGQFVGLLVKNLENIQGDERDIIIMSVCYGYDSKKKMRMNFGPINQHGGEKRLNVAFSRAKQHMALISSIKYFDIQNDYNVGANCLKQYLRYVEMISCGKQDHANGVLREMSLTAGQQNTPTTTNNSSIIDQIQKKLQTKGYLVDTNIGQSHFRCDIGIYKEGDKNYRLGIIVDSEHYDQSEDIIERDLLKPSLLENFGWNITFVLAIDWFKDKDKESKRILALLDSPTSI